MQVTNLKKFINGANECPAYSIGVSERYKFVKVCADYISLMLEEINTSKTTVKYHHASVIVIWTKFNYYLRKQVKRRLCRVGGTQRA